MEKIFNPKVFFLTPSVIPDTDGKFATGINNTSISDGKICYTGGAP
jgi:hypothetical protein